MSDFIAKFQQDFIESDRYLYLLRGLGNTLLIAALAVILGIVLGFLVAIIRSTHDKHGGLNILNFICKVYLTIWRGTPTMVQDRHPHDGAAADHVLYYSRCTG